MQAQIQAMHGLVICLVLGCVPATHAYLARPAAFFSAGGHGYTPNPSRISAYVPVSAYTRARGASTILAPPPANKPQRHSRWLAAPQNDGVEVEVASNPLPTIPRFAFIVLVYVALIAAVAFIAPASTPELEAGDKALLDTLIADPFSQTVQPLLSTLWNLLGIIPLLYTALLLPGSRNQRLYAPPFMILSFFLGFFAIGPYVAFRQLRPDIKQDQIGPVARFFETGVFKLIAVGLLFTEVFLVYHGLTAPVPGELNRFTGYISLFSSSRLVSASSMDLIALSICVLDPLVEDMKRRDWFNPSEKSSDSLKLLFGLPIFGPALYLVCRPALPSSDRTSTAKL